MLEYKLKLAELGERFDRLQEENQEQIWKRIIRGINVAVGVGAGTIDTLLMGGVPVFTIGFPTYDAICKLPAIVSNNYDEDPFVPDPWLFVGHSPEDKKEFWKELGKTRVAYALGATIPFAVRYHKEILNFIYQVISQ